MTVVSDAPVTWAEFRRLAREWWRAYRAFELAMAREPYFYPNAPAEAAMAAQRQDAANLGEYAAGLMAGALAHFGGQVVPESVAPLDAAAVDAMLNLWAYLDQLARRPPPRGRRQRAVWDAGRECQRVYALWPDAELPWSETGPILSQADAASAARFEAIYAFLRVRPLDKP